MEVKKSPVEEGFALNPILVALVVLLVTIVLFFYIRRRKVGRNVVLIGLCDSGKTLLFSQLTHSQYVPTHTSIKENVEEYPINNKSLKLIDIPGHERLRDSFFDNYKNGLLGIIFVVDSSNFQKRIRDVAEYLHNILIDSTVKSMRPKFLIACNKQDDLCSKGSEVIKTALEKELNTLRVTKSSALDSVSTKNEKKSFLGYENKDFDFSQVDFEIEFGETQACSKQAGNDVQIDPVKKWLIKIA